MLPGLTSLGAEGGGSAGVWAMTPQSAKVRSRMESLITLLPEFVNGAVDILIRVGDVVEAATQGIIISNRGPVDAHGGVDGGFDVLGFDVARAGPAGVDGGGAGG